MSARMRNTDYKPPFRQLFADGKAIDGYSIDEFGNVKSSLSNKILSQAKIQGYPAVTLRCDGKSIQFYVHRLVAENFIGPCPDGMEVCHYDGSRDNSHYTNLRYDTRKNNLADRERHGTAQRGEQNPAAVLTNQEAEKIRSLRKTGMKLREISALFGVRESTVSRIANGVRR